VAVPPPGGGRERARREPVFTMAGMESDPTSPLTGGNVSGAERAGRTVRREAGPWTPAVHDFLRWLEGQGLGAIPHVEGTDADREVLTYVEGRGVPVDREIVLDNVLEEAVSWLRDFHDIAADYRPSDPVRWRGGEIELQPDQIICHNDPGAYNWIIQSGHFVAMIDWDMAGPGDPLDDLAFMAWTAIPLYRPIPQDDVIRRVNLLVDAYGEWGPLTVMNAVAPRMETACQRIADGIAREDRGMRKLSAAGEPQRTADRIAAFKERLPEILEQL